MPTNGQIDEHQGCAQRRVPEQLAAILRQQRPEPGAQRALVDRVIELSGRLSLQRDGTRELRQSERKVQLAVEQHPIINLDSHAPLHLHQFACVVARLLEMFHRQGLFRSQYQRAGRLFEGFIKAPFALGEHPLLNPQYRALAQPGGLGDPQVNAVAIIGKDGGHAGFHTHSCTSGKRTS